MGWSRGGAIVRITATTLTRVQPKSASPASTTTAAKKKVKKHRAIAYDTTNPSVATVTKKGVVQAKKPGTCTVYAYAQNGVCKAVKVTVK